METSTQHTSSAENYLSHLLSVKHKYNVSRVSYIDGFSQEDLPVVIAYRPNSKVLSQSGGKGLSRVQATISALMESFECHSAEDVVWDIESTYDALIGNKVNPLKLAITTKDYHHQDRNKWVQVQHLLTGVNYWAPFDAISLDFRRMVNINTKETFFLSSNGLASGSSWENAIVSAIYEVIERHSLTVNELARTDTKDQIDLKSIKDPLVQDVIARIQRFGIVCKLYENTYWHQYPTFKAVLMNDSSRWTGFGTHSSSYIAILRALTEANQARLISISGTREDMNKDFYLSVFPNDIQEDENSSQGRPLNPSDFKDESIFDYPSFINNVVTTTGTNWYVYRYPKLDSNIYVVRVFAEQLHGYNYPGYPQCTILQFKSLSNSFDTTFYRDQHSPAAG